MSTSDDYSKLAEKCYRLASEAKTEADRVACLDLAQSWLEMASRQDEAIAAQIAEAGKLFRERQASEEPQPEAPAGWLQRLLGLFRYNP
ncbi:MAG: hypothetical protein WAK55_13925 [Xanthobacteraceae bacterium]